MLTSFKSNRLFTLFFNFVVAKIKEENMQVALAVYHFYPALTVALASINDRSTLYQLEITIVNSVTATTEA